MIYYFKENPYYAQNGGNGWESGLVELHWKLEGFWFQSYQVLS